jgi:peroxiredoxin Q/BCP
MAQLRHDYQKFVEQGTLIVVIGPEGPRQFANYFAQNELPFIGLPDARGSVLKLYGQEVNLFKLGRMPAQVLVDRQGIARYVHYGHAMSDIPSNEELIGLVAEVNASLNPTG